MKFLIVLASTISLISARPGYEPTHYGYHGPAAPLGHDGRVVDTPEVAHARAAHLAAVAEAASKVSYSVPSYAEEESYDGYEHKDDYSASLTHSGSHFSEPSEHTHAGYGYRGPPAPLDHEGRVIDTPAIAHAKAVHFAAHEKAVSNLAHGYPFAEVYQPSAAYVAAKSGHSYQGPSAPLGHDGRVVDTPEVAHAKVAHYAAYSNVAHDYPHYSHYDTYSHYY